LIKTVIDFKDIITLQINRQNRGAFKHWVKPSVTLILCAVIILKVDWAAAGRSLVQANWVVLIIIFAWMILNVVISTVKWKMLLAVHQIKYQFGRLLTYYFTATFLNNFLPGTIGGDAYRILKTFNTNGRKTGAVVSVFMERLTGILALSMLGFGGAIIGFSRTGDDISRLVIIGGLLGIAITVLGSLSGKLFKKPLRQLAHKLLPKIARDNIGIFEDYRHHLRVIFMVLLLSFLFQFCLIFYRLLLVHSVGATIPMFDMAVVVAVSTIVALIPISLNGIGLLDGSFIYLMTHYHVNYEQAFLVMLLIRLLNFPLGLIGGLFYLSDHVSFKP